MDETGWRPGVTGTQTLGRLASDLHVFLRSPRGRIDSEWRSWARYLVGDPSLGVRELTELWKAVVAFDEVLHQHIRRPVRLAGPAVIVAGSGKETFKTFNVSTAAAILAAAAGARVVKGVSASVSAVSGAADVLAELNVPIAAGPAEVPLALDRWGLAFVPYRSFCPAYADRYDGVFCELTPFSFFMPAGVLAVEATAFVYGIADTRVGLAAQAIAQARPDVQRGTVVSTVLGPGSVMDERAPYGLGHRADFAGSRITVSATTRPTAPKTWTTAVRHRSAHSGNAGQVAAALAPDGRDAGTELVEDNAALIVWEYHGRRLPEAEALEHVRAVRRQGHAAALLTALRRQQEGSTSCPSNR